MIQPVLSALLLVAILVSGASEPENSGRPNMFDFPALQASHTQSLRVVAALLQRGEYAQAEKVLRQAIERIPHDAKCHYNLAGVLARQGRNQEALASLKTAVELGFRDADHIVEDENLRTLRDDHRFKEILGKARQPLEDQDGKWRYQITPATPDSGEVLVTEDNTAWHSRAGLFRTFFRFDQPNSDQPIATKKGMVGDLLRVWSMEGSAAGNHGDLYDNHDGDHSNLDYKSFPQLTRIEFSEAARKRKLHMGAQLSFLYNGVTIGNSSTAVTSSIYWRSQARYALTHPRGPAVLYLQYVNNHMYFYPEHRDHDPQVNGKGHGDVFPANTPYMIISQGSSGSDRVFMNAVAATLAAFRPDVKKKLTESRTLMAAVQMIFRGSNKMLDNPEDYLTGKAHPTVFKGKQINEEKMVRMAHDMTVDSLPPMVQLEVVEEDQPVVGRGYFDVSPREKLFDTPCAIARVVKSTSYTRRMVVSASNSKDLDGKPLTYHWVLLRGDPDRVKITRLDKTGSKAELLVSYHQRRPIAPGSKIESNRVDIGVFVHNGQYYSAPGFVCFCYLDNEKRIYDDEQRIQVVDYTDPAVKDNYVDPLIDFRKDWRDEYHYDEQGELLGWTRIRDDQRQEFTAQGELILEEDANGEPAQTAPVRYAASQPGEAKAPVLKQIVVSDSQ